MHLEIFLADFAVFRVSLGISRKYLNFAGPRPREISEALSNAVHLSLFFIPVRVAKPEQCCLCSDANKDTVRKICIRYNL